MVVLFFQPSVIGGFQLDGGVLHVEVVTEAAADLVEDRGGVRRRLDSGAGSLIGSENEMAELVEHPSRGIAPGAVAQASFRALLTHQPRRTQLVKVVVDGGRRQADPRLQLGRRQMAPARAAP